MIGSRHSSSANSRRKKTLGITVLAALIGSSGALFATAQGSSAATDRCRPYNFVGVRASGEAQGMGVTVGPLEQAFRAKVAGKSKTSSYALVYPAVGQPVRSKTTIPHFFDSVDIGTAALTTYVREQIVRCPNQTLVMAGWSQGATVIDRALRELSAEDANHIAGVALFGDPRFNPKFDGNVGTYDNGRRGIFRLLLPFYGGLDYVSEPFASKTRSYCVAGDPVCNYSIVSTERCLNAVTRPECPHAQYVRDGYVEEAANYLVQQVRAKAA